MVLNKKTIVNLTSNAMNDVKGGKDFTYPTACLYTCVLPCNGT
jgi:hypothetical protein